PARRRTAAGWHPPAGRRAARARRLPDLAGGWPGVPGIPATRNRPGRWPPGGRARAVNRRRGMTGIGRPSAPHRAPPVGPRSAAGWTGGARVGGGVSRTAMGWFSWPVLTWESYAGIGGTCRYWTGTPGLAGPPPSGPAGAESAAV